MNAETTSLKKGATSKFELKRRLPALLAQAASSEEAALEALRACIALRHPVPTALLTSDNLANAFDMRRLISSLERCSVGEASIDLSAALKAIRALAAKNPTKQVLGRLAKTIPAKLLSIAGLRVDQPEGSRPSELKRGQRVYLTASTVSALSGFGLWLLRHLSEERRSERRETTTALVLEWMSAVKAMALCASSIEALVSAMEFGQSLSLDLTPSVRGNLSSESSFAQCIEALEAAIHERAKSALLTGQIGDLDMCLQVFAASPEKRVLFLAKMREECEARGLDISQMAAEWVARHLERSSAHGAPRAADESQSAVLDYVATCLLATWAAAGEGSRSVRAMDAMVHLAEEVFKVTLAGKEGDVVTYDERKHELASPVASPKQVRIARPAVVWSDRIRTRILVRALAEPV